jgi:hypothetical protein
MSQSEDEQHIDHRANLLPEETTVGSDDAEEQARVILEESLDRTDNPQGTREESSQTLGE